MQPPPQRVRCGFAVGSLLVQPALAAARAVDHSRPTARPSRPRCRSGGRPQPPHRPPVPPSLPPGRETTDCTANPQRPVGEKKPVGRDRTSDSLPKPLWLVSAHLPTAQRPHIVGVETADGMNPWVGIEPGTRGLSPLGCFPPNTPRAPDSAPGW